MLATKMITVRLPEAVFAGAHKAARLNGRSLNRWCVDVIRCGIQSMPAIPETMPDVDGGGELVRQRLNTPIESAGPFA